MRFEKLGVAFEYPDAWSLDVDTDVAGQSGITVAAPGGAFWTVCTYGDEVDPDRCTAAVAEQMRREYSDLDVDAADDEIAGRRLSGYDFNFTCLDLTNTASVRSLAHAGRVHVVFCQAEDGEWERVSPVFEAMTTSLVRGLPPG